MTLKTASSSLEPCARKAGGDLSDVLPQFTTSSRLHNERFHVDRTDRLAISLIALLSVIPRLLLLVALPPILHLDSDSYFEITQRLWSGGGFGDLSRRTPLYPLLLSVAGHWRAAGLFPVILVQHLLGMASAVLCYLIARRLFFFQVGQASSPVPQRTGREACPHRLIAIASGLLAGLIIYPALLEHSILSESLFSFLLLAAAYFSLVWFQENRNGAALSCGALLALAALTRPIAAGVFPLWAGLLFPLQGAKQAMRFLLWSGFAFLVILFPMLLRNERAMGSFALTESLGRNLISVTDQLADYDHGVQLPVKSIYREFLKNKRGPDAVVVYSAMPRLRSATHWSDVQIDRALTRIAWEAIRTHPLEYLSARLRRLPLLFRDAGSSEWYTVHAETYLPFLEFIGRLDPELVSRSVAMPSLQHARFGLAAWTFQVFAMDLTSGWLMIFPLLGMAATLLVERRRADWLFVALLAYLWVATILLQPPNGRYRIPTMALEILFAVAGWCVSAEILAGFVKKVRRTRRQAQQSASTAHSPQRVLIGTVAVILAIVAWRCVQAIEVKPVLNISEWQAKRTPASESSALQFRELPVAGRQLAVLYWNGSAGGPTESISANIPVTAGRSYRMQAAYSCEIRECSGALLRIVFLDSAGAALDPVGSISQELAQERSDNDLFWDQIDRRLRAPRAARTMRVELSVSNGAGNLVIPYFSVEPETSVFR